MKRPLIMLILELIGAGMVIAALAMLLTGQPARHHGPRLAYATSALLVLGALLAAVGWLWPDRRPPPDATALDQPLKQAPTAAGIPSPPRFKQISILVDSTPSDNAKAAPSDQHAYASELASRLAKTVVQAGISTQADAQAVPPEAWPDSEIQRRCQDNDLLVTIHMPAVKLPERGDYALWREPRFELRWCAGNKAYATQFRVLERVGDAVPYEQALRDHLLTLLRRDPPA